MGVDRLGRQVTLGGQPRQQSPGIDDLENHAGQGSRGQLLTSGHVATPTFCKVDPNSVPVVEGPVDTRYGERRKPVVDAGSQEERVELLGHERLDAQLTKGVAPLE